MIPAPPIPAAALTVSGDPDARVEGPEPDAAATIVEEGSGGNGFTFSVKGDLKAGPQIVAVLNASDQPHFLDVSQYPEPITSDQVTATLMFDPTAGATPSADVLDVSRFTTTGHGGIQSIGVQQWVVLNLQPGQVVLLCFIPDPAAGGAPHALEGMAALVPVAG